MDKYVKIHDVIELLQENTIVDGWGNVRLLQSLGETRDQLAKVACDDVAKITRCGDCKYGERKAREGCNYVTCTADEDRSTCSPTWFCPRGKPRDEEVK